MKLSVRRYFTVIDEKHSDAGRAGTIPLVRIAVAAVIENPYAGRAQEDLRELIEASAEVGAALGARALAAMGSHKIQSYGKAGIVGVRGEQEHANALLTTTFANPARAVIGGGKAWISSFTKVGGPGTSIDIPLAHKDALYVRSHYDGMTITLPDSPIPDEVVLIFCVANRGRLSARVGGLAVTEVKGADGLT